jgi:hypothetical protein
MSKTKEKVITGCIIVASLITIFYIFLDFFELFGLINHTYPYSIRRISVLFVALIVAIVGKDNLSKKDALLMKLSFLVICCAEFSFFIGSTYSAIGFFLLSHILLTIRNSQGLRQKLLTNDNKLAKLKLIGSGIAIFLIYTLLICFVFFPMLKFSLLLYIIIVYGLILSASFWAGAANYILGLLPKKNSLMVFIGIACFFFSDILVGLVVIKYPEPYYSIANCFIWVIYIPAIILLALSCYKPKEQE